MKLQIELNEAQLVKVAETAVKDWVLESHMVRSLVKDAIYQKISVSVEKVLSENNTALTKLVEQEVRETLANRRDY